MPDAHITQESLNFLSENLIRNNREWFRENRGRYQTLVEAPMLALAGQMMPTLLKVDGQITAEPKRCLSRIWLDMRINRSGQFFRDHVWLAFRRGKGMVYPSYYFEITPRNYSWGVGYYMMPADVMDTVRRWVLKGDARWQDAQAALDALPHFHFDGEEYKRKKFPNAPAPQSLWLNRKSISVSHTGTDAGLLFSDRLAGKLAADFKKLAPVYRLLLEAHLLNEGE